MLERREEGGRSIGTAAGVADAGSRGGRWGAVARVASGCLLVAQMLIAIASVWVLIRMAVMRCGPEVPGAPPRSPIALSVATLGLEVAAIVAGATSLRRARARQTVSAALVAFAVALLGVLLGLVTLAYAFLLALGC